MASEAEFLGEWDFFEQNLPPRERQLEHLAQVPSNSQYSAPRRAVGGPACTVIMAVVKSSMATIFMMFQLCLE